MLKKYSLHALELAINQAIKLDEQLSKRLLSINHKTLEMIISPLNMHFYFYFNEGMIELLEHIERPADTIIYSSPIGLIRLSLLPASKSRSLFNDSIRMSGDIELGQKIKKIFDELEIDWEGHLAQFTGDVAAHKIGSILRKTWSFNKQLQHSLKLNLTEYLQEEIQVTPSQQELNDFFDDIDQLRLGVERLQAHWNQLIRQYEKNKTI